LSVELFLKLSLFYGFAAVSPIVSITTRSAWDYAIAAPLIPPDRRR